MSPTTTSRPGGLIREIDLDHGPPCPPPETGESLVYLLLRWRGRPVGRVVLEPGARPETGAFRQQVLDAAAAGLAALHHDPETSLPADEVAVVVASRNRPADLRDTLSRLRRLQPAPGALVVADSASDDAAAVAKVAREAKAQLVRLERPGLSRARNAGAAAVGHQVVAFLDDDCRVDPGWLQGLCRGFAQDTVTAVTGQLLPEELETPAQRLFLTAFHMDRRGFVPQRFDLSSRPSRHWPLDPWRMGSGGNLAVRRAAFLAGGGFRTDLGLGTPSRGGEDLFFLWDTIRGGGVVVYRPEAMAWHRHHRRLAALRQVMFGYGAGHSAYLRAARLAGAERGAVARVTASWLFSRGQRLLSGVVGRGPLPVSLVVRELAGGAAGPLLARRGEAAR